MEILSLWDQIASLDDGETLQTGYGKITYRNSGEKAGWSITWKGKEELAQTVTRVTEILEQRQESRRGHRAGATH